MPRTRSQGIVVGLLLGTLTLIVYGSLYPFDLTSASQNLSIGEALAQLSWARAGRGDRVANVLLYVPLGFCLILWLDGRVRRAAGVIATIVIGVALSLSIEVSQVFIDQRVPSWWDVVLNSAGTVIGVIAGVTWHELGGRMRSDRVEGDRRDLTAAVVLFLWLAWRMAPFVLELSLSKLKSTFMPLGDPYFSTTATFHYWIWWTLLAHIIFALTSVQRGTESLLALIAVVLASCLVVTGHVFVPSELLALMLLMPTLLVFDRLTPGPRRFILAAAVIGLLIYDSFVPFQRADTMGRFDLWPFMAWIDAGFPVDWYWLARRACYFAAAVWVLKEWGLSMRATTIAVPVGVLGVEVAQLWALGHQASITEPALALAVAWVMRTLDGARGAGVIHRRAHTR
jgi:VanZ family protein